MDSGLKLEMPWGATAMEDDAMGSTGESVLTEPTLTGVLKAMDLQPLDMPSLEAPHNPPALSLVESAFAQKPPRPIPTPRSGVLASHPGQAVLAQQLQYQQYQQYQMMRQSPMQDCGQQQQQQPFQAVPAIQAYTQSMMGQQQPVPAIATHGYGYGQAVMAPVQPHMMHRRPIRVSPSAVSSPIARACVAPPSPVTRAIALEETAVGTPVVPAAVVQAIDALSPVTQDRINAVLNAKGIKAPVLPDRRPLPLAALIETFSRFGGVAQVRQLKKWQPALEKIGLKDVDKITLNRLKRFYAKHIVPLEEAGLFGPRPAVGDAMDDDSEEDVVDDDMELESSPKRKPIGPLTKRSKSRDDTAIRELLRNALNERMYLVSQKRDETAELERRYTVMEVNSQDARTALLEVVIGYVPSCTCPHRSGGIGQCKHILFVLHKVLKVPLESKFLTQTCFLSRELQQIFEDAPEDRSLQNLWEEDLPIERQRRFLTAAADFAPGLNDWQTQFPSVKKEPQSECSMCREHFGPDEVTASCTAKCGGAMHPSCMQLWTKNLGASTSCPVCGSMLKGHDPTAVLSSIPHMETESSFSFETPMTHFFEDSYAHPSFFSMGAFTTMEP